MLLELDLYSRRLLLIFYRLDNCQLTACWIGSSSAKPAVQVVEHIEAWDTEPLPVSL